MGFKDKMASIANKATDALVNAKATYEKGCVEIECFSLKDIRVSCTVKGIVDFTKKTVEFSGVLDEICKDIKKPYFFVSPLGKIFEISEGSTKQETIEITLKTKKENHVITKAKIVEKSITLTKK